MKIIVFVALILVGSYGSYEYREDYVIHGYDEGFLDGSDYTLPQANISGTHYGVGFAIGKTFATRIQQFAQTYSNLLQVLIPYSQTSEGQSAVDAYLAYNAEIYPQYYDEIRGYSDGSGVPLWIMVLLNFEDELSFLADPMQTKEACTDLHMRSSTQYMFAHNEDNLVDIKPYAYIVHAHIIDKKYNSDHQFSAYYYPGNLPGIAYAWNPYGMSFSQNAVSPNYTRIGGLGDNFVSRDVVRSKSTDEAIKRINIPNRAYGFSMNFGSSITQQVFNVEMSANETDVLQIGGVEWLYAHVNMYRRLQVPQTFDPSSQHRLDRINELYPVYNSTGLLDILGDTFDKEYPIYRNSTPPDCCSTLSSVLFDLVESTAWVYITNPKFTAQPLLKFSI